MLKGGRRALLAKSNDSECAVLVESHLEWERQSSQRISVSEALASNPLGSPALSHNALNLQYHKNAILYTSKTKEIKFGKIANLPLKRAQIIQNIYNLPSTVDEATAEEP